MLALHIGSDVINHIAAGRMDRTACRGNKEVTLKRLLLLGTVMCLSCAPPAITINPKSNMVREAMDIRIARRDCQFLGVVEVTGTSRQDALSRIRSETADLEGNTFVVILDEDNRSLYYWSAYDIHAETYKCK